MRRLWVGLLVCVLLLTACTGVQPVGTGTSSQANQRIPVKLGVGYIPNVQFAVFYVGIEKGFYAAEGLDVSLDYGFENDYLKLVGTNQLQFMVGSGDQVVLGRAQGLPVRYVMRWYTRYPVVIFAKKSANITQPADLAGKKIGIPGPFGASYVAFRGILEAAGLKESDVTLESIGFTQAAAISTDKVDAAVDYSVNGPVALAQSGTETTQIKLDQYLKIPANGLVTNEETIQKQPALVRKMVQATQKAIQYTLQHPDEAFAIALKVVPEAGGDNVTVNHAIFNAVLDDWKTPANTQPGATDAAEWQTTVALMQRIGLVNTLVPTEELYTNQFLTP
jgi:NitT/TauT family transport system substrate-binding protein